MTILIYYLIIKTRCSFKTQLQIGIIVTITTDSDSEVFTTIAEVYNFLRRERGAVSLMPSFPNYPLQPDKDTDLIYAVRKEGNHAEAQGVIALDISDDLFHDIQVHEARRFNNKIFGDGRPLSSYYHMIDGAPVPIQDLQRYHSGKIHRSNQVKSLIRNGYEEKVVHKAKLNDFAAAMNLFKMAVDDGFGNGEILAGPYKNRVRENKVDFAAISAHVNHEDDYVRLLFDMTKAQPFIEAEWRHNLLQELQRW